MHLMVDFETLDVKPSAAVVSLGAVLFTNEKVIWSKYFQFDLDSQFKLGRSLSQGTLEWWFRQSKQAQQPFLNPEKNQYDVATFCKRFLVEAGNQLDQAKTNWKGVNIWGNGASFDVPILEDLIRMDNREIPWPFWNIVCFRTFDRMFKIKDLVKREGTHHNAEDDAIYQAECVIAHYQRKKK
jgi:hypothetical protein